MKIAQYTVMYDQNMYPMLVNENKKVIADGRLRYNSPDVVADFCNTVLKMGQLPEEYVYCLALNPAFRLTGVFEISHGTSTQSPVDFKSVFTRLLLLGAGGFVLVHNHPSGDFTPSDEDIRLTRELFQAANIMKMNFCDHVIIAAGNSYLSLHETRKDLFTTSTAASAAS